ncbi:MAG TPA: hypothetical protein VIL46_13725 [Gemmataceae bacterium]
MTGHPHRRTFLSAAAASGAALGLGQLGFLSGLPAVRAEDARLDPKRVRLREEIEPLVRLIEESPRDRLLEEIGSRIQKGLSYQDVLAALMLAGVCNVQPRPSVGFKFHAVLVVNSAHQASLAGPDAQRWLPIFWALDYFKSAQAQNEREGGWRMPPVDESKVPPPRKARRMFIEAMDNWDEPAADAAAAALARGPGAQQVFELFCRYGGRDFRSIGHKAIFVANGWRTIQTIGWRHAEPILRSLAYALLMHEGDNPAQRDAEADRPGRENLERLGKIRRDWLGGEPSKEATEEMLAVLRQGSPAEACEKVVALLNAGVSPDSVWDGLLLGAGELLMRQPGIVGLHTLTTTNALHYAFRQSGRDETRRLLMLQNAAFLPMFRQAMHGRGKVGDARIDMLEPAEPKAKNGDAVGEIMAEVSRDRTAAARKTLAYLEKGDPAALIDAARLLIFFKGNDSHDYKFSSAVLEDFYHVSRPWRDRFLAASMYNLTGSGAPDTRLVDRARAALRG